MTGDFNINTRVDVLIINFPDRQTAVEEEKEFRTWFSRSEEKRRYYSDIQYLWNTVTIQDKTPFDREVAFQRFKARRDVQCTAKKNFTLFNLYSLLRCIAISLIAFLPEGTDFYISDNHSFLSDKKLDSLAVPAKAEAKVKLRDKSVVRLHSGRFLRSTQNYIRRRWDT